MRFPRYHIASSVVNRILDINDQVASQPAETEPPNVPNPSQQGQQLDQALATPPQAVPAPVGSEEAVATEAMQGGSAADAVASLGVLDAMQ